MTITTNSNDQKMNRQANERMNAHAGSFLWILQIYTPNIIMHFKELLRF